LHGIALLKVYFWIICLGSRHEYHP
jgi:hypothetical protein